MLNGTMADPATGGGMRHAGVVRGTHWIIAIAFLALLISGVEIVISHPRFYWGETGNVRMEPLFTLPIPASRGSVPTGYGFVLKDQNSWSRSLHFQTAWVVVFTGLVYGLWGLMTRHFRKNLMGRPGPEETWSYNALQRHTYLGVVFVLFPLMIWTGLAMSPGFVAVFPTTVTLLGGQQSARTMHFFTTVLLVLFLAGHVTMVWRAGFVNRTRTMITGRAGKEER
jgi:thiosulfate reductase cytochrome b subunit